MVCKRRPNGRLYEQLTVCLLSVGLLHIMKRRISILTAAILMGAATIASAQEPIVEYGPAPTYKVIGLHHLATGERGCQMQRYSGVVTAIEINPFLKMLTKEEAPYQTSFTLKVKGKRIVFTLTHVKGISGSQLDVLLRKGKVLRVRALRCREDTRVDSIELP